MPIYKLEVLKAQNSGYYFHIPLESYTEGKETPDFDIVKREVHYTGRVVRLDSFEERIMSDVYGVVSKALVYMPEDGGKEPFLWVPYSNSEMPSDRFFQKAVVDATPEVLQIYNDWLAQKEQEQLLLEKKRNEEVRWKFEKNIVRDTIVTVKKGRKHPAGAIGMMFWSGDKGWGLSYGIATSGNNNNRGGWADVVFSAEKQCSAFGSESKDTWWKQYVARYAFAICKGTGRNLAETIMMMVEAVESVQEIRERISQIVLDFDMPSDERMRAIIPLIQKVL